MKSAMGVKSAMVAALLLLGVSASLAFAGAKDEVTILAKRGSDIFTTEYELMNKNTSRTIAATIEVTTTELGKSSSSTKVVDVSPGGKTFIGANYVKSSAQYTHRVVGAEYK